MGEASLKVIDGRKYTITKEEDIYKLPSADLDVANYPVVDMTNVYVFSTVTNEPANILLAHPTKPVSVEGLVKHAGRTLFLHFPIVSGFSVEDGDAGLRGVCKLFFLGNCCWFRLCTPHKRFKNMFSMMHLESRIYWILRDSRGDHLNLVDAEMARRHPSLSEGTRKYKKRLKEINAEYEIQDVENYEKYWQKVHQMLRPDDLPDWPQGLRLASPYISYLLHHMIVDQEEFMWPSSWLFHCLGQLDIGARDQMLTLHNVSTTDLYHVERPDPVPKLEPRTSKLDLLEAPPAPKTDGLVEDFVTAGRSSPQSRKRKRSESEFDCQDGALSPGKQISAGLCTPEQNIEMDKSRGWNDFEKLKRAELASQHPTLSKKSVSRKLGRLFRDRKSTKIGSDTDESQVSQMRGRKSQRISIDLTSDGAALPYTWGNIKSCVRIERANKNRFSQIIGRNDRQAKATFETLQTLLYEEDVTDLALADIVHVWSRDYDIGIEKVAALVSSQCHHLLKRLSGTDHREIRVRGEEVSEVNVWRSTTLYSQLYKLEAIDSQDSDLLALISWNKQDPFCKLQYTAGMWSPAEDSSAAQVADLQTSHNPEVIKVDQSVRANKGRSSLRPIRAITNSSSPDMTAPVKAERRDNELMSPLPDQIYDSELVSRKFSAQDIGNMVENMTHSGWTTSKEFTVPVHDPISKLRRSVSYQPNGNTAAGRGFIVSHLPATTGNNAGIWRCRMPGCYFFQEDVDTIESQSIINDHYMAHADTTLESLELIGQAGYASGSSTAALLNKLEAEAILWTQAMRSDTLLLGS